MLTLPSVITVVDSSVEQTFEDFNLSYFNKPSKFCQIVKLKFF